MPESFEWYVERWLFMASVPSMEVAYYSYLHEEDDERCVNYLLKDMGVLWKEEA